MKSETRLNAIVCMLRYVEIYRTFLSQLPATHLREEDGNPSGLLNSAWHLFTFIVYWHKLRITVCLNHGRYLLNSLVQLHRPLFLNMVFPNIQANWNVFVWWYCSQHWIKILMHGFSCNYISFHSQLMHFRLPNFWENRIQRCHSKWAQLYREWVWSHLIKSIRPHLIIFH